VGKSAHRRRDADPEERNREIWQATFADLINNNYPINTVGRARAYITSRGTRKITPLAGSGLASTRAAAKARVALPDPDEFVELMSEQ
jgi:2-hydroxychromene-2-carboxylate isomerase